MEKIDTLSKKELLSELSEKTNYNLTMCEAFLDAFEETVKENLKDGRKITMTGFGSFEVVEHAPRESMHPVTKERIMLKASKLPKFRASKVFKDFLND